MCIAGGRSRERVSADKRRIQSEPTPRPDRGLEVLNRLSDKHSAGAVLTETDHVMMTRLLERFETGLA